MLESAIPTNAGLPLTEPAADPCPGRANRNTSALTCRFPALTAEQPLDCEAGMHRNASREAAGPPDALRLEAFLRSLVGVRDAAIRLGPGGRLERLSVVPAEGASERQVRMNVVSALLAGPGVAVDASVLAVVAALPGKGRADGPGSSGADDGDEADVPDASGGGPGAGAAVAGVPVVRSAAGPHAEAGFVAVPNRAGRAGRVVPSPVRRGPGAVRVEMIPGAGAPGAVASGPCMRLVDVDLSAVEGQLRCRVVVGLGDESFMGVVETPDRPGARLEVAARAAADALRVARAPATALRVEGVAVTDLVGRPHVLVSIGLWAGDGFEAVPGVAAVGESWEEATARAVLNAVGH
jgi:hypothetical protein